MYLRILQKRQCSLSLDCYIAKIHSGKPVAFKMSFVLLVYIIMKKIKITDAVFLKLSLDLKAVVVTMQIENRLYSPQCFSLSEYLKYILKGALPVD